MKVSPGCISARNTRLVGLGAGVRLHVGEAAAEQLLARSIASFSAMSTNWQPP